VSRHSPPINIDDLPPALQAKVREELARVPQQAERIAAVRKRAGVGRPRDEAAIARKRGKTGGDFEADLNMLHRQYEGLKWGYIWPHSPPFVRVKNEWRPKAGGGPVDRTGHVIVRVERSSIAGDVGWEEVQDFHGVNPLDPSWIDVAEFRTVPVAFDAKVLDEKSSRYRHDPKKQHQLHQLRDAARAGVFAFLLVFARQIDRVFTIPIENYFSDLIRGRGVELFEWRTDRGVPGGASHPREAFPLLPSVARNATRGVHGFDWIPLLPWCEPGANIRIVRSIG
jgi:hypothetical protein